MRLSKKLICGCAALLGLMFSAPSQAMGELENVTLTVYVNPVGAPHAYLENDITHPQGLDVDIIYELQRRLLFNLRDNRIYPLDRDSAFARMQAGEADLVGGGISYTMARAKIFKFTPIVHLLSIPVKAILSIIINKTIFVTQNNYRRGKKLCIGAGL